MRLPSLTILDHLPDGLLAAEPVELLARLGGPTLVHLSGRQEPPLFVSVLLHGNEEVGWRAVQRCLADYGSQPLPRSLSLFIGNVYAAQAGVRRLPGQPDYNRVWPGADDDGTREHHLMRRVVEEMRRRSVFASVDFHNNTGLNPHYACINRLDTAHLNLAALFSRTAVYFRRPHGVQSIAFSEFCPSVVCECGKVGDPAGVVHAAEFLNACLHLSEFPRHPVPAGDLNLFHTLATIRVAPQVAIEFLTEGEAAPTTAGVLHLRHDLEMLNFQELPAGTVLGWYGSGAESGPPLEVTDETGRIVTHELLEGARPVRTRQTMIPSMFTHDIQVIRQDCLGYFMERCPVPEE